MPITPIQTTAPDQIQAPQKVGGAGGHKAKAPQANQMAHAANAKGSVADFKSQIARQLEKAENTAIADDSRKKDPGTGNEQSKKPRKKPESPHASSNEEASGLINVMV